MNGVAMNGKHQPTTGVHPHHLESLVSPADPPDRDRASLVSPRLPVTLRIGVDTGHGFPTLPRRRASLERAVPRVASRRRRQAIHGEDGALLLHGAVRRPLASLVRVAALAPASLVRVADQALLPLMILGRVDRAVTVHPHRLLASLVRVAALAPASLVRVAALAPASLVRVLPLMILGMVEEDASVTHGVHHPSGDHLAVQSLVREARAREVSQAVMMESG